MRDPRLYQIATLTGLLAYGMAFLRFDVGMPQVVLTLLTALLAQLVFGRSYGLPRFDPRSALISGLSLCLLLRTEHPWVAAAASVAAVGSKFVLRWRGKHVFNPTNGALVAALATGQGWVSPGQWGSSAFFAFLMACLGGLVVNRALRSDVTAAFLASHVLLVFGRTYRLGDPLAIPLHQLQSGALLLFAFFMISDPKTTPDSRAGRMLFAALVAAGAYLVQFRLYRPNGLLWSLAACSPVVPLIDRLLPGTRYQWGGPPMKGRRNEASADVRLLGAARAAAGPPRLGLLRLLRGEG
jgi:Na+-transporting NADH:ubiquinone oxidoreductase subunit NqrB